MNRRILGTGLTLIVVVSACAGSTTTPTPSAVATAPSSAPPAASVGSAPPSAAVTLRVVTVEPPDSPEGQAVEFFADEVERLTGGSLAVEPASEAGESDQDNISRVASGDLEAAIVQARNWDEFGVTSMQALQAPFLITSDALAAAATSGDLAGELMAGLDEKGVEGLALWPIDLRHPVSFGEPFLTPDDMTDANIRIVGSTITKDVIESFGANPFYSGEVEDSEFDGAESAFDRAYSLPAIGTFTGNVTFYPRVDVFFISKEALAGLTPEQQAAVRSAAEATRKHVADSIVPDATQAKGYCADEGGHVALADEAGVAAFEAAVAPVLTKLEAEPDTKDLINQIRGLSAPDAGPAIEAC